MPRFKRQHLKRRKDGRFVKRHDGQWFYSSKWGKEEEVFQQIDDYDRRKAAGSYARENPTLRAYTSQWLPIHKAGVGEATYNQYAYTLDRILSQIGDMEMRDISSDDLTRAFASMRDLSSSYITKTRNLLKSIFEGAVAQGYINTNPMNGKAVDAPKGTKGTHRAITDEERDLIHNTDHPFKPLAMVMLYSGMRPEEARGVNIERDVDFDKKVIYVRQAISYSGNTPIIGKGKTERSQRSIILLPILEEVLKHEHGDLGISHQTGKLMTQTAYKRAWESYVFALEKNLNHFKGGRRWWGKTKDHITMAAKAADLRTKGKREEAKKYDLPPWKEVTIRPYDLRHSFCTMCRDNGIDIHVCMKMMGHSSEKMILQVYDHVTDYREKISAETLLKIGLSSTEGSQSSKGQSKNAEK